VYRFVGEGDRYFCACEVLHPVGMGRDEGTVLAANFIVVGQGPKLHPIGFGARRQYLRGERAIRYHGVAVQVGVQDGGGHAFIVGGAVRRERSRV
jgi:hypothetical protein